MMGKDSDFSLPIEEIKAKMKENPQLYKEDLGERDIDDLGEADFDFQGWLIPQLSLRRILTEIGFKIDTETNRLYISNDSPILDTYPNIILDDGMGYGHNIGKVNEVVINKDDKIEFWSL